MLGRPRRVPDALERPSCRTQHPGLPPAVAALLLSKNPSLTPAEIQAALRTPAVDIGPAGPDDSSGAGRLDALAAAQAVGAPACAGNRDCADGNACTTDSCERGTCRHQPVSCDDG
ncbi:MAG: hypothetical protein E6J83_07765, partial [Deltaproteobacteria bacterium]